MNDLRIRISQNGGALVALGLFLVLYLAYSAMHPRGFSSDLLVQNSNEATVLILLAMAQTLPVLMGGIDLSVGALMTLVNATASVIVNGAPGQVALGCAACVALGALGGLLNGLIIVFGRLQPIVVTLATGAVFNGAALFIRPTPGGRVDGDLGWVMTNALAEWPLTYGWWEEGAPAWFAAIAWIPTPIVLILLVVLLIWLPFRNSETGRAVYAVGSNEAGAYMSGVRVERAKLAAYTLGGVFAGLAGLYFAIQTGSGNADPIQAGTYTLNSIAAVVIGGASLLGGAGGAIGSIFGVLVLRSITFLFRVVGSESPVGFLANPMLQPMFEGLILLVAVSIGAARVMRMKNRLDAFR